MRLWFFMLLISGSANSHQDDEMKSFIQTTFQTMVLTETPSVEQTESLVASIVKFFPNNKELAISVREEIVKIKTKADMQEIFLVEHAHLREAESQARIWMEYLQDIFEQTDPVSTNQTITKFIEVCKKGGGVLQYIQIINNHMEQALRKYSEYQFRIKAPMNKLKYKILCILHQMNFLYLFQHHFQAHFLHETHEELQVNIGKLSIELELFRANADRVMADVCNINAMRMLNPGDVEIEEDCDIDVMRMKGTSNGDTFWKGSQTNDGKEYAEATMQTALAIIGTIPGVGTIAGVAGPLLGLAMKDDANDKMSEMIYRGFQKINAQIDKVAGILVSEIKLQIVRDIENTAHTLVGLMGEIHKQTDPEHKNRTILDFLRQCELEEPFSAIVKLEGQIKEVLTTQWESDPAHSKTYIKYLKERLMKCLHKLAYAHFYQQHFRVEFSNSTIKERDDRINQLDKKLKDMGKEIASFLDQLARKNYWDGMNDAIANLMNRPAQNLSATSNLIELYLRDIYTSDKFCVVTHLIKPYSPLAPYLPFSWANGSPPSPAVNVHAFVNDDNEFHFENKEYIIGIVRSKSAHDTETKEFYKKVDAVTDSCRDHNSCKLALKRTFPIILKQLTDRDRKADENNIVRCRINSARTFETPCEPWSDGKMALSYPDETCKGIAFPS